MIVLNSYLAVKCPKLTSQRRFSPFPEGVDHCSMRSNPAHVNFHPDRKSPHYELASIGLKEETHHLILIISKHSYTDNFSIQINDLK